MNDDRIQNWQDDDEDFLPDELKQRKALLSGIVQQGVQTSFDVGMCDSSLRSPTSDLDEMLFCSPLQKDLIINSSVFIRQKKDFLERLVGIERRNIYDATGENRQNIARIEEDPRGFFGRYLLGHWRSYNIQIWNCQAGLEFRIHHPFCFFLDDFVVYSRGGQKLGTIVQKLAFWGREMDVFDEAGTKVLSVVSNLLHPWTFHFFRGNDRNKPIATIFKRLPGILSFLFTDGDNFELQFKEDMSPKERTIIFCAAVAIDMTYFEIKG